MSVKLVPFNELPEAGAGAILAGAIRAELAENGYTGRSFIGEPEGGRCLNCSERRPEVGQNNGHCDECLVLMPVYPYTNEQLADCSVVCLNIHNPDLEDLVTPDAVYELVCKAARHGRKHLESVA